MQVKSALLAFFIFSVTFAFADPMDSLRVELKDGKKFIVHRVTKTEGLAWLAYKYGVEESDILSANPLVSDKVFPGQVIRIPLNEQKYRNVAVSPVVPISDSKLPLAGALPTAAGDAEQTKNNKPAVEDNKPAQAINKSTSILDNPNVQFKTYVVASPQNVNHLAETFGLEPKDIIACNNLKNNNLKVGQKVKIPMVIEVASAGPPPVKEIPKVEEKPLAMAEKKAETYRNEPATQRYNPELKKPVPDVTSKTEIAKATPNKVKPTGSIAPQTLNQSSITTGNKRINPDSLKAIVNAQQSKLDMLVQADSNYTLPDGVAYQVFDYGENGIPHDVFYAQIAAANMISVNTLSQNKGAGDKNMTHTVKKDETLQSIAARYKVTASDLINWNGLLTYRVSVGQDLIINAERAAVSPYVRTLSKVKNKDEGRIVKSVEISGLAISDIHLTVEGVYSNNVEKGKFIYIRNKDNFLECSAMVLGPLPKGTPKNIVLLLDKTTAEKLEIGDSMTQIVFHFDKMEQGVTANK